MCEALRFKFFLHVAEPRRLKEDAKVDACKISQQATCDHMNVSNKVHLFDCW